MIIHEVHASQRLCSLVGQEPDIDPLRKTHPKLAGADLLQPLCPVRPALVMVSFTYMRSEADRVWRGSPTMPLGNGLAVLCKHPRDMLPRNLLL